jgi:hypothetical protein
VFAVGFLVFTLMLKVAVPIALGELRLTAPAPERALANAVVPRADAPAL